MADPIVVSGNAYEFQRDLSRYWRHVRRNGVLPITAQGWVYKNAFKLLLGALNAPADAPSDERTNPRLWFMRRLLLQTEDLIVQSSGALATAPNLQLFGMSLAERMKYCFEAWRDLGLWNEVYRVASGIEYDPRVAQNPPELSRARHTLLRTLARLQSAKLAEWVPVERLVDDMKRANYDWLFPRNYKGRRLKGGSVYYQTPYYYNNNPYSITFTNVTSESQGWDAVERVAIVLMLAGPLTWMGLVDVTYAAARPDERTMPLAVRLTPVGTWLLGLTAQPDFPVGGGRLVVQPNFTVIAIEPIADAVLVELDGFADVTGGDRAINYAITRQSVYRAQRNGASTARIASFLETHSGAPVPTNVKRTLDEWDAQHNRITFHRNTPVLQYADDEALAGARVALGAGNLHPIAPGFVRIERSITNVAGMLMDAGWSPLITPLQKPDAQGTVALDESGRIAFLNSVPSIHTLAAIAPYAEGAPLPNALTATSVRAAMSQGRKLDDMLGTLENVFAAKLPHRLETSLRAWAGFYGSATLKPMVLLELSSAEVLANLAQDKELRAYLMPIEGSAKPLALVRAEHADDVRAALVARGVVMG